MSKLNHLPNSKEGDISKFILNSFQCVGEENKTKGNVESPNAFTLIHKYHCYDIENSTYPFPYYS